MEILKRFLFWFITAAILLVAGILYVLTVPDNVEEAARQRQKCEENLTKVKNVAANPKEIKNHRYVGAAREYGGHLREQEKKLQSDLESRKFTMPQDYLNAPTELLQFDQVWLKNKREKILAMAKEANLGLPPDFAARFLYENRPTESEDKRRMVLSQLALTEEVVRILTSTRATITRTKFTPSSLTPDNEEAARQAVPTLAEETVSLCASTLDHLEQLDPRVQADRERLGNETAYRQAGVPPADERSAIARVSQATTFDLRFTAPFAVISPALQALESSSRYFGIIRRIDCQRVAQPYPSQNDFLRIAPGGTTDDPQANAAAAAKLNTHFQEAPIQVQITMDMVTLAPPPAPR